MNNKFAKISIFIISFICVHLTEITYLPSFRSSINTILKTQLSNTMLFAILFFIFSVVPFVFFLAIALWLVRYCICEPKNLLSLWKGYVNSYLDWIFNSMIQLTLYWCITMPYDPIEYFFVRYASTFPETAFSNIYSAEITVFILSSILVFYFLMFKSTFDRIVSRFTFREGHFLFLLRNWQYSSIGLFVILYHIIIPIIVFIGLDSLQTSTSYDITNRYALFAIYNLISIQSSIFADMNYWN